jgi:ribosomal subunit interface protein
MDIVVRGRNVEVPEHYRQHVAEKLARLERYDNRILRADVELHHEKNPRQAEVCQRVEITCRVRGPVVRAEACASDFYKALDIAAERLERKFRQAADRRRVHYGRHSPTSVSAATSSVLEQTSAAIAVAERGELVGPESAILAEDGPGHVVREKEHPAKPMTIDQALFEMELVGHDFYLFADADSGQPSVVYRRHAYDYGVIRLVD